MSDVQASNEQANFERHVLFGVTTPSGFVSGHRDAMDVMRSEDYQAWFFQETQRDPSILSITDPVHAIGVMDRYKAFAAAKAAKKHAATKDPQKEDLTSMMTDVVETGHRTAPTRTVSDEDRDPEELFDEEISN